MARPPSGHPTELELRILKILWRQSPWPVRDIRQALADEGREIAHTSVITTLNIMTRKKYLKRTKQRNAFYFEPRVTRRSVSESMLGDLVDRVFDGSATEVMLSLFHSSDLDADELKHLRKLINRSMKEQSE
jgi:predicted transcriptional regulator